MFATANQSAAAGSEKPPYQTRKTLAVFFPCCVGDPRVNYGVRFVLLGCCVIATAGLSDVVATQDPYQHIPARNVFDLKEPPAPASTNDVTIPNGKLILTGITTMLGNKRAILKRTAVGKPSEASKEESFILAEGQHDGALKVLMIDERAGTVRVDNSGIVSTLNFERDGLKPSTSLESGSNQPPTLMTGGTNSRIYGTRELKQLPIRRDPMPGPAWVTNDTAISTAPYVPGIPSTNAPTGPRNSGQLTPEEALLLQQLESPPTSNVPTRIPPPAAITPALPNPNPATPPFVPY